MTTVNAPATVPSATTPTRRGPHDRLVWAADAAGSRFAGAWWPTTRNAATELRALLPVVSAHLGGRVTRVSLNIEDWNADQPRRLRIGDQLVRLGWFHTLDPATVTLGRGTYDRITLVVLPPDYDPAAGRELLDNLAGATRWPDRASTVLGRPD